MNRSYEPDADRALDDDGFSPPPSLQLRWAIDGMLGSIKDACNPTIPDFANYIGSRQAWAVAHVKQVVRMARKLGLLDEPEEEARYRRSA